MANWKRVAVSIAFLVAGFTGGTPTKGRQTRRNLLLKDGTVILWDEKAQRLNPTVTDVLVKDGVIAQIGTKLRAGNAEVVDVSDHIVSPGFVDTHRHGWQTVYRAIAPNIELSTYYYSLGQFGPSQFIMSPEDIYISQLTGMYEALAAGVTTIVDHAHHTWSPEHAEAGFNASLDSGVRTWYAYAPQPTIESPSNFTLVFSAFNWQLEQMKQLAARKEVKEGKIFLGLGWDFMQADQPEQTKEMYAFAQANNFSLITLHYHGGFFDNFVKKISLVDSFGLLNISTPIVFSHATKMTEAEAALLRETNQHVSLTTESEMTYGMWGRVAHTVLDQCALGVDTHLTFSSDMVTQMRMSLQAFRIDLYEPIVYGKDKLPSENPMTARQAFLLGTINGGRALRRDDIGVIKVGAKADFAIFSTDSPAMIGADDPIAAIILHSSVQDIKHVIVEGEFKKRDGKLVGVDWKDISRRFLKTSRRVRREFLKTDWKHYGDGLSNQLTGFMSEDYEQVPIADVLRGEPTGYETERAFYVPQTPA